MLVKNLKIWSLALVAVLSLVFTSCDKDIETETTEETGNFTFSSDSERGSDRGNRGGDRGHRGNHNEGQERGGKCFELVFPITVQFADESTATVESKDSLRATIKAWFNENDAEKSEENRPSFVFPIQVIQDSVTVNIASEEEFETLRAACKSERGDHRGDRGHKGGHGRGERCFELVFPITVQFADESTATVENKDSLRATIKAWFNKNDTEKSEENKPSFVFPIQVIQDSVTVDVASEEEFEALRAACKSERGDHRGGRGHKGGHDRGERCFSLVFPVSFDFNGDIQSFDTEEAKRAAFKAYRAENGRGAVRPTLVYPVTIEFEDGTQVEVADKDELETQKESCE